MCLEYEWEYMQLRAEEARRLARKIEDDLKRKPKPAAPAGAAPEGKPKDAEPVPV